MYVFMYLALGQSPGRYSTREYPPSTPPPPSARQRHGVPRVDPREYPRVHRPSTRPKPPRQLDARAAALTPNPSIHKYTCMRTHIAIYMPSLYLHLYTRIACVVFTSKCIDLLPMRTCLTKDAYRCLGDLYPCLSTL